MVAHRDGRGAAEAPRIIAAMLLVIDIGNTNVTTGLVRSGALIATRRVASDARVTGDAFEVALAGLLGLDAVTFADVTAIACASVVPALTSHVETVAERRDLPLTMATAGTVPIAVRVDRPSEVGADRLVNALAAARLYGAPAVVVGPWLAGFSPSNGSNIRLNPSMFA